MTSVHRIVLTLMRCKHRRGRKAPGFFYAREEVKKMITKVYCNVCNKWVRADIEEIRVTDEWIEFLFIAGCGHRSFIKILEPRGEK
jgi:hypothetical protein